ncbi:Hypothetical protein PHPALM_2212 [Phytophthora palmivora]|uniref:Uncharacterized protein n=1 Tax=Phytophthora palmivora TaxID=4796 RepID=A0A2P4YQC9_9STRA|nr:Hypothetical protein PHPALM_2212 [Phytophthora palmivora]
MSVDTELLVNRMRLQTPVLVDDSSSHTSYEITQSPTDGPIWTEMKRRHLANVEELQGKLAAVPRHWLFIRFLNNSFFARRLMRSGMLLSLALLGGYVFHSAFVEPWLDDHKDSDDYDNCSSFAEISSADKLSQPAAIILSLPGSGVRSFEPFKRDDRLRTKAIDASSTGTSQDAAHTSVATIRRCFVF